MTKQQTPDLFPSDAPAVYVDDMRSCLRNPRWPFDESCHLFILPGPLEPLHRMARALKLKPQWFQSKAGKMPHYDLTANKRLLALRLGAKEATLQETGNAIRAWRAIHP